MAVAETMMEGARLEMLLQHDRLGLDREMEFLTEAAKDGRMQQICAIQRDSGAAGGGSGRCWTG